jgi:hypothetical protein
MKLTKFLTLLILAILITDVVLRKLIKRLKFFPGALTKPLMKEVMFGNKNLTFRNEGSKEAEKLKYSSISDLNIRRTSITARFNKGKSKVSTTGAVKVHTIKDFKDIFQKITKVELCFPTEQLGEVCFGKTAATSSKFKGLPVNYRDVQMLVLEEPIIVDPKSMKFSFIPKKQVNINQNWIEQTALEPRKHPKKATHPQAVESDFLVLKTFLKVVASGLNVM